MTIHLNTVFKSMFIVSIIDGFTNKCVGFPRGHGKFFIVLDENFVILSQGRVSLC